MQKWAKIQHSGWNKSQAVSREEWASECTESQERYRLSSPCANGNSGKHKNNSNGRSSESIHFIVLTNVKNCLSPRQSYSWTSFSKGLDIQIRKGVFQVHQKMSDSMSKDTDFFHLSRILCMESVTVKLNSNPEKGMLQKIFQLPDTWKAVTTSVPSEIMSALLPL